MQEVDREDCIARYEQRLDAHGYSPQALGWGENGRQEQRFAALTEILRDRPGASVLDVGCGFADLYDFLTATGWHGRYRGIDLVPRLVDVARERHPGLDVEAADLESEAASGREFDVVVASGIFNWSLRAGDNHAHIERSLRQMLGMARIAACADFLSTHVDFRHESAWHTDPGWAAQTAGAITTRFAVRHDYMPFEFALTLYRDHPGP